MDSSPQEDSLVTPRSARCSHVREHCVVQNAAGRASASTRRPPRSSPSAQSHCPGSASRSGAGSSVSPLNRQRQQPHASHTPRQGSASTRARRLRSGSVQSIRSNEATAGNVHPGNHTSFTREKLELQSSLQCKPRARSTSTVIVNAVTSPHSSSAYGCSARSSALGRPATPTATLATPANGSTAAFSPSGKGSTSPLLCPATSCATRSRPSSDGGAAVYLTKQSRSAGDASALLGSGAGGFPVAGASGGAVGAALSHPPDQALGGVGRAAQNHCSHCKVAEEVLYLCPCGLARYCCTACQRAQWPFHKAICGHAVRAIRPLMRRCDGCRTSSQTLRQCGCGYAYYCDTFCQRADWRHHSTVCSMVFSQARATTLGGPRALRARREVATQTAHWQISAPVIHPTGSRDCATVVDNATGTRVHLHTSLRDQHLRPGSDGEDGAFSVSSSWSSLAAGADATVTPQISSPYGSCIRALPENGPQAGANSGSSESATFDENCAVTRRASSCTSAGLRTTASTHTAVAGGDTNAANHGVGFVWEDSCSARRHHRAPPSLHNSLYISTTAALQHAHDPLLDASRFRGSPPLRFNQGEPNHGVAGSFLPHQHYRPSPSTDHYTYLNHAGESKLGDRSLSTVGTPAVRDQPGVVAFLIASRHILEREETKARTTLFRAFRLGCGELHMRKLNKKEEEERMSILREEVLWCVLTGSPAWKKLKQELQRLCETRK